MIRILLMEDSFLRAMDFRAVAAAAGDIEIVGEADFATEALALFVESQPDMVLLDVNVPLIEAQRLVSAIKRVKRDALVLVACDAQRRADLRPLVEAGARGCVVTADGGASLASAIRGLYNLEQADAAIVSGNQAEDDRELPRLKPREMQILSMISEGRTNREIAAALRLTPGTVRVYVSNILRRLGAGNRTQAAYRAVGLGLLRPQYGAGSSAAPAAG